MTNPNPPAVVVELLPCPNPWCGDHIYCTYNRPPLWRVKCGCGVQGPTGYTEAEAITAWNTRSSTHAEPAERPVDGREQWDAALNKLQASASRLSQSLHRGLDAAGPVDGDAVERVAVSDELEEIAFNAANLARDEGAPVGNAILAGIRAALAALPDIAALTAQLDEMKAAGDALAGALEKIERAAGNDPMERVFGKIMAICRTSLAAYRTTTGEPT